MTLFITKIQIEKTSYPRSFVGQKVLKYTKDGKDFVEYDNHTYKVLSSNKMSFLEWKKDIETKDKN